MALSEAMKAARRALELARVGEAERVTEAMQISQVVGFLGEAEVGKTETIRQAIGHSTPEHPVIALNLDGAASDQHLAFLLARQIASAYLGAPAFSILKAGALVPASLEAKRPGLAELLGVDGLEEGLRDWPSGEYELPRALAALERLAIRRKAIVWIDHLEAPRLTPRHPLDLEGALWAVREMVQRQPDLRVVLSGRDPIEGEVLGREAGFHQQGRWLSLHNPPAEVWRAVASRLNVSAALTEELAGLTDGHPETMLVSLTRLAGDRRKESPDELLRDLASTSTALAARAMQHARSLHRLGGQVLNQIALGQRPYAAARRGKSPPQEIRKVLGRLHLAGLIRHREGWSIVNPLIGIVLREEVRQTSAPDRELEDEGRSR